MYGLSTILDFSSSAKGSGPSTFCGVITFYGFSVKHMREHFTERMSSICCRSLAAHARSESLDGRSRGRRGRRRASAGAQGVRTH
jgi:hypothetical protein